MDRELAEDHNREGRGTDRGCYLALATALFVSGLCHFDLAARLSPTPDEFAHLAAGLAYIELEDFYQYSVNPPLAKNVAAIPAWILGVPAERLGQAPGRPEFASGWDFPNRHPDTAWTALVYGRRMMWFFVLLGAVAVFLLGRNTLGILVGTVGAALWLCSPIVLGSGPLIQCDIPAAALGALAVHAFHRWTQRRTWRSALLAGGAFGCAIATKYTWFFGGYLFAIWFIADAVANRRGRRELARSIPQCVAISLTALLILNGALHFTDVSTPISSRNIRSLTFQTLTAKADAYSESDRLTDRLLTAAVKLPLPLPGPTVAGIDVQMSDLERARPAFYLGEWHETGSFVYYPATLAAKLPLSMWIFFSLGLGTCLQMNRAFTLLWPLAALLCVLMVNTDFNEHVRYAYVVLPYICVIAAGGVAWAYRSVTVLRTYRPSADRFMGRTHRFCQVVAFVLLIFGSFHAVAAGMFCYPGVYGYTNRAFGSTHHSGDWVGGSAIDWDHAWLFARDWIEETNIPGDSVLTVRNRWTTLAVSGWQLEPFRRSAVHRRAEETPWYVLVPTAQRQKLEHAGWNCFDASHRIDSIHGSIEVYAISSRATLANFPTLFYFQDQGAPHLGPGKRHLSIVGVN